MPAKVGELAEPRGHDRRKGLLSKRKFSVKLGMTMRKK
jgi:hypothetical protein